MGGGRGEASPSKPTNQPTSPPNIKVSLPVSVTAVNYNNYVLLQLPPDPTTLLSAQLPPKPKILDRTLIEYTNLYIMDECGNAKHLHVL